MGVAQQILAAGGGFTPLASSATWNPSSKSASMTLSNGNLTAACSTTSQWVRASVFRNAGKFYFEFLCQTFAGPNSATLGMIRTDSNNDVIPDNGFGWRGNSTLFGQDGTYSASLGVFPGTPGNIGMIAVDLSNFKAWVGVNGTWALSGDPATGTNGFVYAGSAQSLTPYLYSDGNDKQFTANFGATPFVYPVPAGFTGGFA